MLLTGIDHVAVLTRDTDRLCAFYGEVFGAEVVGTPTDEAEVKITILQLAPGCDLNVFEIAGNVEADRQTPMFGRGRLDHMGLRASSIEAFEALRDRLVERGCSDGFVTDFGPVLSLFWVDPDGLEGEVCVANPDAVPGVLNPPGTPAERYADG
jgi:catechol 2,3-dioxygenase-like lactoylglutathione lyase family enzyme